MVDEDRNAVRQRASLRVGRLAGHVGAFRRVAHRSRGYSETLTRRTAPFWATRARRTSPVKTGLDCLQLCLGHRSGSHRQSPRRWRLHLETDGPCWARHANARSALCASVSFAADAHRSPRPRGRATGRGTGPRRTSDAAGANAILPTLGQAWPRREAEAAMCVQDVDVQCVLQFTLIHAASCALHRRTSRVIHRTELSLFCCLRRREMADGLPRLPVATPSLARLLERHAVYNVPPFLGTGPRRVAETSTEASFECCFCLFLAEKRDR